MKKQKPLACHRVFRLVWSLVALFCMNSALAADKMTIGWLEKAHISEAKMQLRAKIDTGADNSSLKAIVLKNFSRDGDEWVRFQVADKQGHAAVIERKVVRYTKIKSKMALSIKRPVVMLGICLGGIYRNVEVNLAKRKKFKYHMLIGRNFLHGSFLVDSERQYTTQPSCLGIKG